MNSPQMPHQPKLSVKQRQEKERDEYFAELHAKKLQLERTLWLVIRTFGKEFRTEPTVTINQEEMSLLWDLKFSEDPAAPGKLTLTANLLPEASDEQIDRIRRALLADPSGLKAALDAVGLPDHPAGYLQGKLMEGPNGITWDYEKKRFVPGPNHHSPEQEPPNPPAVAL